MKEIKILPWCVLALSGILFSANAFALKGFSRACSLYELPSVTRPIAARLFNAIGTAPAGKFNDLPALTESEMKKWWVLESLTVDWDEFRYYLYTEQTTWYRNQLVDPKGTYRFLRGSTSDPDWKPYKLPDAIFADDVLRIHIYNRKFFSARAGHPEIFEYLNYVDREYLVVGYHYYYDPGSRIVNALPASFATNCNLLEWGIEWL